MYRETLRPAWVEIDLAALDYNVKQIQTKIGSDKKIIGVVKADAYGHGAIPVSDVLKENGIDSFAIATLAEAISLREHFNKDVETVEHYNSEEIIVLGLVPSMYADVVVQHDLVPVVCDFDNVCAFSDAAVSVGKTVRVLIAADTGMGRIGYLTESEADIAHGVAEVLKMQDLPGIEIAGVISHMSTADEADKSFAHKQTAKYDAFCKALDDAGVVTCDGKSLRTFANSAAVMELADTHYNAVRPGIILYGCYPSADVDKSELSIKPVMSVKGIIVHLKDVPSGFSVGYGRKYISDKPAKIATVALGYADGYPRRYSTQPAVNNAGFDSNAATGASASSHSALSAASDLATSDIRPHGPHVIVNGVYAPLAGKICMDQFMVDVTDVPDVKLGDEVIVMGSMPARSKTSSCADAPEGYPDSAPEVLSVTAEDIAAATGTINYEILCDFGTRLPKVYKR